MAQGCDATREMVLELLDEVERRHPADRDEVTWHERAVAVQSDYEDALEENERLEAARDALADECAELRDQVRPRDRHYATFTQAFDSGYQCGINEEREACARVAESHFEPLSDIDPDEGGGLSHDAWNAACRRIAAVIRARGTVEQARVAGWCGCPGVTTSSESAQPPSPFEGQPTSRSTLAQFTTDATTQHMAAVERCLRWFAGRDCSLTQHDNGRPERRTEVHERGTTLAYVWSRLVGDECMTQTADADDCNYVAPWHMAHATSPITGVITTGTSTHQHEGECGQECEGWGAFSVPIRCDSCDFVANSLTDREQHMQVNPSHCC